GARAAASCRVLSCTGGGHRARPVRWSKAASSHAAPRTGAGQHWSGACLLHRAARSAARSAVLQRILSVLGPTRSSRGGTVLAGSHDAVGRRAFAAQAEKIGAGEGVVAHATRRIRAGANSPGGEPGPLPG